MTVELPFAVDDRRISRKLTVNIDQQAINVRPVIKSAIKEAAHTLKVAYAQDSLLSWFARGLEPSKQGDFLYSVFKNIINTATLQSRDFAVQVDGCKGVLLWTTHRNGCPWPYTLTTAKLAKWLGWVAALRVALTMQPTCVRMRKRVMANYTEFITIGYMGVLPHEQRKGLGGALLQFVIDRADAAQLPIYIQVDDTYAIQFFEKYGFTVEARVDMNGDSVALMVRDPVVKDDCAPQPLRVRPGRRISGYTS